MAHYYVVRQKLDKTGAEDKVRYYGVPVTCGRVICDLHYQGFLSNLTNFMLFLTQGAILKQTRRAFTRWGVHFFGSSKPSLPAER